VRIARIPESNILFMDQGLKVVKSSLYRFLRESFGVRSFHVTLLSYFEVITFMKYEILPGSFNTIFSKSISFRFLIIDFIFFREMIFIVSGSLAEILRTKPFEFIEYPTGIFVKPPFLPKCISVFTLPPAIVRVLLHDSIDIRVILRMKI